MEVVVSLLIIRRICRPVMVPASLVASAFNGSGNQEALFACLLALVSEAVTSKMPIKLFAKALLLGEGQSIEYGCQRHGQLDQGWLDTFCMLTPQGHASLDPAAFSEDKP